MRIKLLNDGGFGDMDDVEFPAVVDAERGEIFYMVKAHELYRIGADKGMFGGENYEWAFSGAEVEVIHES